MPDLLRRASWPVLAALVAVQWLALAIFALAIPHNGWLYYQGGDQTKYYTTSWLVSEGLLPHTEVSYGWPLLLAPVSLLAGPNVLDALPAIVLVQVLIGLPLALLCIYGIVAQLAGRLLGFAAAGAWIAAPYAAIPLFDERYHDRYVDQLLPQALGLTAMADFPSMVLLLVAAYLVVRALRTSQLELGIAAGLVAGLGIAVKPSNALFLAGPFVALALARRGRALSAFALGLVPMAVTLALWKQRALGEIPAFAFPEIRTAASAGDLVGPVDRYVDLDWSRLRENYSGLREFFWSAPLLVWLAGAGFVGLARRSWPVASLFLLWLAAFVVAKGTSEVASVENGSFLRLLIPAYPAFFALAAGVPLLVPRGFPTLFRSPARPRPLPQLRLAVAGTAAVLAAVPLAVTLAVRPLSGGRAALDRPSGAFVPVVPDLRVRADRAGDDVVLRWRPPTTGSTSVVYRIFRARSGSGVACLSGAGAADCTTALEFLGTTRANRFQFGAPRRALAYRVGVAASYRDVATSEDVVLLSRPVRAPGR